ncbi:MAG: type II secretion system F family protein [Methanomassiliicoccales archaeon]
MATEETDLFSRFEGGGKKFLETKTQRSKRKVEGPHPIKLPAGAVPTYVKLTPYQQFCWRVMKNFVEARFKSDQGLEDSLIKAHMRIRPEEFVAEIWMTSLLAGIVGFVIGLVFGGFFLTLLHSIITLRVAVIILLTAVPPAVTYMLMKSMPASKAKTRGRDIDKHIGSAMSFISALASADVNVDVIFSELAKQPIYGEIQKEAEWITRDTTLLGVDILTALKNAAARTPSSKFEDFLQGVVTTARSGGQLKPYFLLKAEQFEKEEKLTAKQEMETLGLFAETFVTVVVAFPLFLVVIIAIMSIVSSGGGNQAVADFLGMPMSFNVLLLYVVVLLMIPASQGGFIFFVWNMSKEASQ